MHVEEIMTTSVKSCGPDDSLDTAARLMWEHDCGCVPVIDQDGRVLAMLTDRDVCMAAYTQGRTLAEIRVSAAMSNACHAVSPNDPVVAAERLMQEHQVRRLPAAGEVLVSAMAGIREKRLADAGPVTVRMESVGPGVADAPLHIGKRRPSVTRGTGYRPPD